MDDPQGANQARQRGSSRCSGGQWCCGGQSRRRECHHLRGDVLRRRVDHGGHASAGASAGQGSRRRSVGLETQVVSQRAAACHHLQHHLCRPCQGVHLRTRVCRPRRVGDCQGGCRAGAGGSVRVCHEEDGPGGATGVAPYICGPFPPPHPHPHQPPKQPHPRWRRRWQPAWLCRLRVQRGQHRHSGGEHVGDARPAAALGHRAGQREQRAGRRGQGSAWSWRGPEGQEGQGLQGRQAPGQEQRVQRRLQRRRAQCLRRHHRHHHCGEDGAAGGGAEVHAAVRRGGAACGGVGGRAAAGEGCGQGGGVAHHGHRRDEPVEHHASQAGLHEAAGQLREPTHAAGGGHGARGQACPRRCPRLRAQPHRSRRGGDRDAPARQ